jgi:N-acyl-D-amino-acid deacylase
MKADVAIFDPWTLNYTSEYGDPHHYSEGMAHVLVNGRPVISEGGFTDERPGSVLKKTEAGPNGRAPVPGHMLEGE